MTMNMLSAKPYKSDKGMHYQYKPFVYLFAAFGIWVACLTIMDYNKGGYLSKLENVRTYKLKKMFDNWNDVYDQARKKIDGQWDTSISAHTACFTLTDVTSDAACKTRRQTLVTDVRSVFKCGVGEYRSPFCSCVHKVLDPVLQDTRLGTTTPSLITATFTSNAVKNIVGRGGKDELLKSIESCHFLHHTTTVAEQPDAPWARRSIILFILSTLVTLALLDFFVLVAWGWMVRIVVILVFLLIIFLIPLAIIGDNQSSYIYSIGLFVFIPAAVIFVWVEAFLSYDDVKHFPFLHPAYFPIIHSMLVIYALIQNGVLDEDLLRTEIFKSQTMGYLYLCLCFYSSQDNVKTVSELHSIQDSTFLASLIMLVTAGSTAVAPFAEAGEYNILWSLPLGFVILAVIGALWIDTEYRFGGNRDVSKSSIREVINVGTLYQAAFLLMLLGVAAWYGVAEWWKVEKLFVERYLTTSVQYNLTSQAWQNPVFAAPAY